MSLVYLAVTNPLLPLFIGFDEKDSGESAGEVTEQLDLHSEATCRVGLQHRLDLLQISLRCITGVLACDVHLVFHRK